MNSRIKLLLTNKKNIIITCLDFFVLTSNAIPEKFYPSIDNCNVSLTSLVSTEDFCFFGFWAIKEADDVVRNFIHFIQLFLCAMMMLV